MMTEEDQRIVQRIGMQDASETEQRAALERLQVYIGEAISDTLTEAQLEEYQSIIDDDQAVIAAWLETYAPDYENAVLYQEFVAAEKHDPEHNSPKKLFASIAWIDYNVPNRQEIIDEVIDSFSERD